jgi:hypothetical protein
MILGGILQFFDLGMYVLPSGSPTPLQPLLSLSAMSIRLCWPATVTVAVAHNRRDT